jgi:hypothetical protein
MDAIEKLCPFTTDGFRVCVASADLAIIITEIINMHI